MCLRHETNNRLCQSNSSTRLTTAGRRSGSKEGAAVLLGLSTVLAVRQSVLHVLVRVHDVLVSSQVLIGHHSGLDDLDRSVTSTVGTSHLRIALLDSTDQRGVAVLLVHVVSTRARVVTQPDSVVLHLAALLEDLAKSPTTPQTRTSFTARISPVPFFIL